MTEQEHQQFVSWLHSLPEYKIREILEKYSAYFENAPEGDAIQYPELSGRIERILDGIDNNPGFQVIEESPKRNKIVQLWKYTAVAVALLLISSAAFLFFKQGAEVQKMQLARKVEHIVPGSNKAVLTLADGKSIVLSGIANGRLAQQNTFGIDKLKDGELAYTKTHETSRPGSVPAGYNTLTTPRGGKYTITLPDGTKVWLNAGTTLKFPAVFAGTERVVDLSGEAYFEVSKNKLKPFIVNMNHTQIRVLGTHFNVMAYADEPAIQTTLLEGSVRVSDGKASRLITPGQQAVVNSGIAVIDADINQVMAWKNGNFAFNYEQIHTVMNKISRWYDVDIEYRGKVTQEEFVGVIPRSKNLSDVLHTLQLTGLVHFKIEERRIIVME